MMQPGRNQKFVEAAACLLESAVQIDEIVNFAFYLNGGTVFVNSSFGSSWIVGLLLEAAPIQVSFEDSSELVNSSVCGLISSQ